MPTVDPLELLITWTDPTALAAAALTLAAGGFVIWRIMGTPAPDRPPEESASDKPPVTRGKATTLAEHLSSEEVDSNAFLSRFVHTASGEQVGETVAITDEAIVLKREGTFFLVGLDAILEKDGVLLADANIDWDAAEEAGEAWRAASEDAIEYDEDGMPVLDRS